MLHEDKHYSTCTLTKNVADNQKLMSLLSKSMSILFKSMFPIYKHDFSLAMLQIAHWDLRYKLLYDFFTRPNDWILHPQDSQLHTPDYFENNNL
jgi:hypothetical protein